MYYANLYGIGVPLQDSAINLLKSYEGKEFHTDMHNLFICKMLTQAFISKDFNVIGTMGPKQALGKQLVAI